MLLRAGIAVVVDMVVVFLAVRTALVLAGHPDEGLTHAVLPAVFGGMLAFLGSLGGTLRTGIARAFALSLVALPLDPAGDRRARCSRRGGRDDGRRRPRSRCPGVVR